ncbi:VWA domain-containing protein [Pontibacter sp. JAM-7]|uniref:VWA domain-containing protein n=1 Tax=Pontibacter sp. JAM-7 TaxID=3366581 RepID=UPI003AF54A0F
MLTQFHFLQPYWLALFPLLLALGYWLKNSKLRRSEWHRMCDPELLPYLEQRGASGKSWWPVSLVVAALLLSVAAAQPVWKQQPQPVFNQPDTLVIALDLSASMNATDLKPSRLQRARFKIEDLLTRMQDAQIALLVYAADAYSVTPLTEDGVTITAQLPALTSEIMPAQGSRADRALQLADELLTGAGISHGNILLVTDAVSPAQIAATATQLRAKGRQLSILAVGTEQGAPINTERGPLRDQQGQVVISAIQPALMQEAAGLGGGKAVMISLDDSDIRQLVSGFQSSDQNPIESEQQIQRWIAEGPWFVLLALPLLLPLFRRGLLNLILPALLLSWVLPADAVLADSTETGPGSSMLQQYWQSLWQTPDQQAYEAFQAGDKQYAANTFHDPSWQQLAHYEAGNYQAALEALPNPQSAAEWYNQGNILARTGQLEQAVAAYDQALAQDTGLEDARHNRQLVQDLLNQQQPSNDQGSNQNDKSGGARQDEDENTEGTGADSESSEGGGAMDGEVPDGGAQGGSSKNGKANDGDFDEQSQASEQHAKSNAAGKNAATHEGSANDPQASDQQQTRQQLEQQLKQQLDKQLAAAEEQVSASEENQEQTAKAQASADALAGQQAAAALNEQDLARQQMLNRIDDDPTGLWRRKFMYQYRDRADNNAAEAKQW